MLLASYGHLGRMEEARTVWALTGSRAYLTNWLIAGHAYLAELKSTENEQ
jgi:hypothetical protein